nr:hypothetical protein GCM10020185_86240 [Pseudomonas brassicacearum subsp. brassicacearum]
MSSIAWKKRRLLILAMLSSAIGFILLTFAENLYLTTMTVVITETASALFLIGSKAILSENLPMGQRAKAFFPALHPDQHRLCHRPHARRGDCRCLPDSAVPDRRWHRVFFSIFLMTGIPRDAAPPAVIGQPPSFSQDAQDP